VKIEFLEYIKQKSLINNNDEVLLAVSGGIDSVVMAHLFYSSGYRFSIAHCNFNLRGKDSDEDAVFVENLAKKYQCKFYLNSFQTIEYSKNNKISIQIAARQLRFSWFDELLNKHNYLSVALAHNANDVAETVIINLCRGTGLKGLHGIMPQNKNYIHPLLFAKRADIELYTKENNLEFREDISNKKDIYTRNNIRLNVIRHLNNSFENVVERICKSADIIKMQEKVFSFAINNFIEKNTFYNKDGFEIEIDKLLSFIEPQLIIFELFAKYGFSFSQINNIYDNINKGISGVEYYSEKFIIRRDRAKLILSEIKKVDENEFYSIKSIDENLTSPIEINFFEVDNSDEIFQNKEKKVIYVDFEKIKFPLIIRKWRQGDFFFPIGMKGKKKVSDFFNDNKIDLKEKTNIYLLISNNEIVWIINYRMSDKFKVDVSSKKILKISTN